MDEITSRKLRAVGAIAVLVIAISSIFFIFLSIREKKNTALRLRMYYSDMSQTLQFAMNTYGAPGEWGWHGGYRNANVLNSNLAGSLRLAENCIDEPGECMPKANYKTLSEKETRVNLYKLPSVKLQNGISMAFETISSCKQKNQPCVVVYADINNTEEPNMFGKDLFVFMIVNSSSIPFLPYNSRLPSTEWTDNMRYGCNKKADIAMYCSALIYSTGWSIDKNYPW